MLLMLDGSMERTEGTLYTWLTDVVPTRAAVGTELFEASFSSQASNGKLVKDLAGQAGCELGPSELHGLKFEALLMTSEENGVVGVSDAQDAMGHDKDAISRNAIFGIW